MDELTIGDKTYISSKRAAEITGYAKDYVGQLCREGHVEAKMVGRSWYVLESSITKHRFGEPVAEEALIEAPVDNTPMWEAAKYSSDSSPVLPELPKRDEMPSIAPQVQDKSISDMQSAWKEWFENRGGEARIESPEVIEAREEKYEEEIVAPPPAPAPSPVIEDIVQAPIPVLEPEEEVAVAFHRIPEPEIVAPKPVDVAERVPIRRIMPEMQPQAVYAPMERNQVRYDRPVRARRGINLITAAILVVVAIAAISVAVIGSGYGEKYVGNNPVVKFLDGTRTINK